MPRHDELKVAGLTLQGVAQGGVQTSIRVPELKLLFDVGRAGQPALRYDRILISHGHQDHAGGLPYLLSQRGMMGKKAANVHLPIELKPQMLNVLAAWQAIEGFEFSVEFHGHRHEEQFPCGGQLRGTALKTHHRVPSLAFVIERKSDKLKAEFVGLSGQEIRVRKEAGEQMVNTHYTPLLCVTGDTKIEFFEENPLARRCAVLVHEVTAWDERRSVEQIRAWGHTHVDEMIAHSEAFEGEALVLVHRSMRHTRAEAEKIVRTRFPASVRDRVHVFGA